VLCTLRCPAMGRKRLECEAEAWECILMILRGPTTKQASLFRPTLRAARNRPICFVAAARRVY
jgi:hypothetical protein